VRWGLPDEAVSPLRGDHGLGAGVLGHRIARRCNVVCGYLRRVAAGAPVDACRCRSTPSGSCGSRGPLCGGVSMAMRTSVTDGVTSEVEAGRYGNRE